MAPTHLLLSRNMSLGTPVLVQLLQVYFARILVRINNLAITIPAGGSRFEPGITPMRSTTLFWPTLTVAAEDAGASRLYGGIHFDDGNQDGLTLGTAVSERVLAQAQTYAYDNLGQEITTRFSYSPIRLRCTPLQRL